MVGYIRNDFLPFGKQFLGTQEFASLLGDTTVVYISQYLAYTTVTQISPIM